MQGISLIWEAFVRFWIRYFESKALRNDQVDYLRMEIEKLRLGKQELIDYILKVNSPAPAEGQQQDNDTEWKPIVTSVSWETKRRQLEEESRKRAIALANEARVNIAKAKSTEELEAELLTGTD